MEIQQWAFVVGLVVGSSAVLAVIYVWIKKQVFGIGGGAISLAGAILMSLSIWSSVRIQPVLLDPPVKVFELNLTKFTFPNKLPNDNANFRFLVNLRFTNDKGQFTTEHAVMPGLDTFWECATGEENKANYVRAVKQESRFNMDRINQWDPLIFRVKGREVHSIRFEVFDVNRIDAWDTLKGTLKEIMKNTVGAAIIKMKSEIPEKMPLSLSESLGGAADELEFVLLKKLANAKAEKLLFRGSTKLDGIEFEEDKSPEVTVKGKGKKGDYTIKFNIQKAGHEKSGVGNSVARPSSQKPA